MPAPATLPLVLPDSGDVEAPRPKRAQRAVAGQRSSNRTSFKFKSREDELVLEALREAYGVRNNQDAILLALHAAAKAQGIDVKAPEAEEAAAAA